MKKESQGIKFLLGNGRYFPKELPPLFVTSPFANNATGIWTVWNGRSRRSSFYSPETYSAPRGGKGTRRELAIVHPVPHLELATLIVNGWDEISKHCKRSDISSDTPVLADINSRPFDELKRRKLKIAARHNHMLASDFSRFYGTLYTHTIPWALHGKKWCKENLGESRDTLGGKIDSAVALGQQRETIGIPIGPYTSRIISEIVAVAVDLQLQEAAGFAQNNAVRHWDDWVVGLDGARQEHEQMAALARACREFRIEINGGKTKMIPASSCVDPIWIMELRAFEIAWGKGQKSSLARYFSLVFDLMGKFPGENILLWAVKKAAGEKNFPQIVEEHWGEFEDYLMLAVRTDMAVLGVVGQILSKRKDLVNIGNIRKLIVDIVQEKFPLGHHFEVAWALFLARAFGVKIPGESVEEICRGRSSVCALLVLDLKHQSLIEGSIDENSMKRHLTGDGLRSDMWLLAYEAVRKGWLAGVNPKFVENDKHFGVLLERGVYFYEEDARRKRNVVKKWQDEIPFEDYAY